MYYSKQPSSRFACFFAGQKVEVCISTFRSENCTKPKKFTKWSSAALHSIPLFALSGALSHFSLSTCSLASKFYTGLRTVLVLMVTNDKEGTFHRLVMKTARSAAYKTSQSDTISGCRNNFTLFILGLRPSQSSLFRRLRTPKRKRMPRIIKLWLRKNSHDGRSL